MKNLLLMALSFYLVACASSSKNEQKRDVAQFGPGLISAFKKAEEFRKIDPVLMKKFQSKMKKIADDTLAVAIKLRAITEPGYITALRKEVDSVRPGLSQHCPQDLNSAPEGKVYRGGYTFISMRGKGEEQAEQVRYKTSFTCKDPKNTKIFVEVEVNVNYFLYDLAPQLDFEGHGIWAHITYPEVETKIKNWSQKHDILEKNRQARLKFMNGNTSYMKLPSYEEDLKEVYDCSRSQRTEVLITGIDQKTGVINFRLKNYCVYKDNDAVVYFENEGDLTDGQITIENLGLIVEGHN